MSIIAISGKLQSGKSTVGKIITDLCEGWEIKMWSYKVKQVASLITGEPVERFEDNDFKQSFMPEKWKEVGMLDDHRGYFRWMTYRHLLQRIGTEAMRNNVHKNVWVYALLNEYQPNNKWVICDTRFLQEIEAVNKLGGCTIRVERTGSPKNNHESETALDGYKHDYVIVNDGTTRDLIESVSLIMNEIQENLKENAIKLT